MVGLDSSINEIFSLDCINSGQSTIANTGILGPCCEYFIFFEEGSLLIRYDKSRLE